MGQEVQISPSILQTQLGIQIGIVNPLVPSGQGNLVARSLLDFPALSHQIPSPHTPLLQINHPIPNSIVPQTQLLLSTDDTSSETVDEEMTIRDKEELLPFTQDQIGGQPSHHYTKADSTITNSGGQGFSESSSSGKKRLKKERKLRNQGNT